MNHYLDFWKHGIPVRDFNNWQRAADRLMAELSPAKGTGSLDANTYSPSCEVSEDANQYTVKFEVPGIPKEKIRIELDENRLVVSGERIEEKRESEKDRKRHLSEFFYGSFMRSFTLPTPVNAEKTVASYDNGILTVTLAKASTNRSRQISVL